MADFARALDGERTRIGRDEFGALVDAYLREASSDKYARYLNAVRSVLIRDAEYRRLRLIRLLDYGRHRSLYAQVGLSDNDLANVGVEKSAYRRLLEAKTALDDLQREATASEDGNGDGYSGGFLREVAAVGRRMGFGIDINTTKIGTYIGYLALINAEDRAMEAEKAKKQI